MKINHVMAVVGLSVLLCNSSYIGRAQCSQSCKSDSASVVSTILARRSVRKYKANPVRHDQMEVIIECAINAPSGMNKQPWLIRVVDNPDFLNGGTKLFVEKQKDGPGARMTQEPGFRNVFRNAP